MTDRSRELATALAAARAAADVHRQQLGRVVLDDWSEKGAADFVTFVDHEAEARIVDIIQRDWPTHDILAEEAASAAPAAALAGDFVWIADPLDGTTNFLHGYPMYCASVALLHAGVPVAAAVVCAATGEEWTAQRAGGAFRNGVEIRVSECPQLRRALIGTGFPFKKPEVLDTYLAQFRAILTQVSDIRRGGSAALDLCHVASGFLDGFWELDLRPWDYAAGVLLVREAGGVITGITGAEPDYVNAGGIIAGNASAYEFLRRTLGEFIA